MKKKKKRLHEKQNLREGDAFDSIVILAIRMSSSHNYSTYFTDS